MNDCIFFKLSILGILLRKWGKYVILFCKKDLEYGETLFMTIIKNHFLKIFTRQSYYFPFYFRFGLSNRFDIDFPSQLHARVAPEEYKVSSLTIF